MESGGWRVEGGGVGRMSEYLDGVWGDGGAATEDARRTGEENK